MSGLKRIQRIDLFWRQCLILTVAAYGVLTLASVSEAAGPAWIHDIDEGKRIASAANKDLAVVFTGRGWCQPCELLDQYVFQDQEFAAASAEDYVFIELDFTFGDSIDEQERETKYLQLKKQYLVPAYPTVVLMDAHGLAFATMVGYSKDVGPERMAEQFKSARVAKLVRDEFFRKAQSAGNERARIKHLHEGIQAVASQFASLEQHGDDPVLAFYGPQVDEILSTLLDPESAIRLTYVNRANQRDAWQKADSVRRQREETLRKFAAAQDYRGAIEYLDSILPEAADTDVYWQLQVRRQEYQEAARDYDGAIRNAQQLLNSAGVPARARESILDSEARCLESLNRSEEAIAHYDRRIEASAADPKRKLKLLCDKGYLVQRVGQTPEAIEAWKAYRDFAQPKSFEWLTATSCLARYLQKSGDSVAALSLFEQILSTLAEAERGEIVLAWPWSAAGAFITLEAAECHIAKGTLSDAKELIDRAVVEIDALRISRRQEDKERANELHEKVTALRAKLAGA
jgi:thioredoxin-related protein